MFSILTETNSTIEPHLYPTKVLIFDESKILLFSKKLKPNGLFYNSTSDGRVEDVFQDVDHFYAPILKDRGHIVLPLSVCPSVCLHKLNMKT